MMIADAWQGREMRWFGYIAPVVAEARRLLFSRPALYSALLLLPIAALFTGMGAVTAWGEYHGADLPDRLLLTEDGSLPERFEYLLTAAAALAMLFTWARAHQRPYLTLAALLGWLTADNALQLHERGGRAIQPLLEQGGLNADISKPLSELVFFILFGVILLIAISAAFRSAEGRHRDRPLVMVALIVVTAGFGVALDLFDGLFLDSLSAAGQIGMFVEDAGELWCFTLMAIASTAILAQTVREEQPRAAAPAPAVRLKLKA